MLFIYRAHESSSRRQYLIHKDENCLLRRKLDALTDYVDELPDRQICWHEILLLIDGSDVRLLDLLADDRNAVGILLSDPLCFGLALLKGVLVLELGSHDNWLLVFDGSWLM